MKDALCCLFICYLTVRLMIRSYELTEKVKCKYQNQNKKNNKRPIFMINVLKYFYSEVVLWERLYHL